LTLTGVGAGNFWGVQRIFCLISPNLPEKKFCDKLSPNKLSVAVGAFYFPIYSLACWHRLENRILGSLLGIIPTEKVRYRLCKNIDRNRLVQYCEHLPHSSEVWRSIHIADIAVSKEPHK